MLAGEEEVGKCQDGANNTEPDGLERPAQGCCSCLATGMELGKLHNLATQTHLLRDCNVVISKVVI